MKLFKLWSKEQIVEAITALEQGIAVGAQSVSYPAGGSVSYTTLDNAKRILGHLYARYDELEGNKTRKSGIKFVRFVTRGGR